VNRRTSQARRPPRGRRNTAAILLLVAQASGGRATAADEPQGDQISLEALVDMVISATLREQSAIDAPASITVVSSADIRARGYRTIKQIMNDVPGFNDVSDTNEEIVAVRGVFTSTTNKILILINGHRMNDLMLGRYNVDQYLGLDAVERVEFIRGPASALYGTGALVGVVNIVTRRGADVDGGEAKLRLGTTAQELGFTWGKQPAGYDVFFNATYFNDAGHELPQDAGLDVAPAGQTPAPGAIYLGRYRENASALLTVRTDSSMLALRAAHFRRVPPRGSNGSFYVYDAEPLKPAYTENDFFVDYSYHWQLGSTGATRITFNPSLHYFGYYEQSFITFGANRLPPLGERSGMQGEFTNYQLKLTAEREVRENLDVIVGLDGLLATFYRSDAVSVMGDRVVLTPDGYTTTGHWFLGGTFLQAVWAPWKALTFTLGGRYDTFEKEASARFTPRLGMVYRPTELLALKVLYGRSYLAPMWAHKRANDGNFVGNPSLNPETFEGLDLIAAYGDRRGSASIDIFYNSVDGLINSVRQPGSNLYNYQNSGQSLYLGVELAAEAQVWRWLRLQGSYAHLRPDSGNTSPSLLAGTKVKDIAPHTFRYGLRLEPTARLGLSLWGRAYAATPTSDPITMTDVIPAVFLLDATLTCTWRRFTLQLIATNLTDRYHERGGTVSRPLARERLNVQGAVSARF
jgi:iron complex outermembrane receptor protein